DGDADGDYTGIDGEEYEYLGRAEAGEYAGTSVEILSQWVDAENAAFSGTLADFADRTGINLITDGITNYEEVLVSRVEGNNPPDLAQIAQPGLVTSFANSGHLV